MKTIFLICIICLISRQSLTSIVNFNRSGLEQTSQYVSSIPKKKHNYVWSTNDEVNLFICFKFLKLFEEHKEYGKFITEISTQCTQLSYRTVQIH